MKILKVGTENGLCEYFWTTFLKTVGIFEISTLKLVKLQSFAQR